MLQRQGIKPEYVGINKLECMHWDHLNQAWLKLENATKPDYACPERVLFGTGMQHARNVNVNRCWGKLMNSSRHQNERHQWTCTC